MFDQQAVAQIRGIIDEYVDLFNTINNKTNVLDALGIESFTFDKIIRIEILNYWLFLTASDGVISDDEVDFINAVLDYDFSASDCKEVIIECNIYSEEYENRIPFIVIATVYAEEYAWKWHRKRIDFINDIIGFFDLIGSTLLNADGYVHSTEIADHSGYMGNLRDSIPSVREAVRERL